MLLSCSSFLVLLFWSPPSELDDEVAESAAVFASLPEGGDGRAECCCCAT